MFMPLNMFRPTLGAKISNCLALVGVRTLCSAWKACMYSRKLTVSI
jgi:hypothetical protein